MQRDFPQTHPGEILLKKFLKPIGSQYWLIKDTAMRINKIIRNKRGISIDTARYLTSSPNSDLGTLFKKDYTHEQISYLC
ncbi:hypothetical protein GMMP15_1340019 [Candidatus Magnetomoraceae bacterium gMMP-15]